MKNPKSVFWLVMFSILALGVAEGHAVTFHFAETVKKPRELMGGNISVSAAFWKGEVHLAGHPDMDTEIKIPVNVIGNSEGTIRTYPDGTENQPVIGDIPNLKLKPLGKQYSCTESGPNGKKVYKTVLIKGGMILYVVGDYFYSEPKDEMSDEEMSDEEMPEKHNARQELALTVFDGHGKPIENLPASSLFRLDNHCKKIK